MRKRTVLYIDGVAVGTLMAGNGRNQFFGMEVSLEPSGGNGSAHETRKCHRDDGERESQQIDDRERHEGGFGVERSRREIDEDGEAGRRHHHRDHAPEQLVRRVAPGGVQQLPKLLMADVGDSGHKRRLPGVEL